jgi:hypothetical protein
MSPKLSHWVHLAASLGAVIIAWLLNQEASGALVVPAVGITALTAVGTFLGWYNGSAFSSRAKAKAVVPPLPILCIVLAMLGVSCTASQANTAKSAADVVATLAGDVCSLLSQDDPTAPTWAQVACKVEGVAAPVVVSVPWSAWLVAQGTTLAEAKKAKAKGPHALLFGSHGEYTLTSTAGY